MAEPASVFDPVDEQSEARMIAKARAEVAGGEGVPHRRVREWLLSLAQGNRVPPPTA